MIEAEDKDWTWVLERACPDCGFDAASCPPASVPGLARSNAATWAELAAAGALVPVRPDEDTWSPLEYACHVRDVYALAQVRLRLMLDQDRPTFANWDQDATAVEDRYDRQDPARVAEQVLEQAAGLARLLERVEGDDWERSGRRSDGAVFTVGSFARYVIHDPVHHVWDVTGARP